MVVLLVMAVRQVMEVLQVMVVMVLPERRQFVEAALPEQLKKLSLQRKRKLKKGQDLSLL
jgi:hypothetical protein